MKGTHDNPHVDIPPHSRGASARIRLKIPNPTPEKTLSTKGTRRPPMVSIKTTHTGSLPRPPGLAALIVKFDHREPGATADLQSVVEHATRDVVRKQVDTGIDIVSDGEYSKVSYVTYVKERLTGFNGPPRNPMAGRPERDEFPDYDRGGPAAIAFPTNDRA